MKKYQLYFYLLLAFALLNNCKEEMIGQYPTDNVAPQPVSKVVVDNLPGRSKISYQLPDEEDLLYVQALYDLPSGKNGVTKTSVFSNSMLVKGFGKSQKQTVQLISVDRSQNESTPLNVEIEPLDSPIYGIMDSLKVQEAFGGFKLSWPNFYKEDIVMGVLKKSGTTGEFSYIDNFYSSEALAQKSVRGLDSTKATFGIFVRDTYDNYTDTLVLSLKPYFEEEIPKSGFVGLKLSSRHAVEAYGGGLPSKMWDGITNVDNNLYYLKLSAAGQVGQIILPIFTFDMGVKAKLSRFRLWQRVNYLFALHNPKLFEWYGTNDATVANNAEDLNWQSNPAWVKLMSGESKRPSGLAAGSALTTEDTAYAKDGEEFEFPLDAPAVRYLRFKLISTWSGSSNLHINELTFWGQIEK
ncbi:MAG: hypothetical protein A2W90_09100 [Bacteroidetes bacterium GWF2_42_66]|nr:MAG: hypothetical protein A2W92_12075 [Bacteroidetes bacterium GWA2_42_15]OFY00565.1 MAG: hypothetical protein A2W89_20415 [Bacteroidetes bacterium GWE2_42_39]OFY42299.1 MAG: hypothetical protein A2W90_09100 [Bacteroidetes bacterium GWF2_42_66]HAZ02051.1 hypothetical protein [Marinilabiliales bacterium]HBL76451.1 hypothetical protein [Prolixibacteraceae bacterium]